MKNQIFCLLNLKVIYLLNMITATLYQPATPEYLQIMLILIFL